MNMVVCIYCFVCLCGDDGIAVNNSITSICSSCVSSLIITGCEDSNVYLWDLRKEKSIHRMYVVIPSLFLLLLLFVLNG